MFDIFFFKPLNNGVPESRKGKMGLKSFVSAAAEIYVTVFSVKGRRTACKRILIKEHCTVNAVFGRAVGRETLKEIYPHFLSRYGVFYFK